MAERQGGRESDDFGNISAEFTEVDQINIDPNESQLLGDVNINDYLDDITSDDSTQQIDGQILIRNNHDHDNMRSFDEQLTNSSTSDDSTSEYFSCRSTNSNFYNADSGASEFE
ncbi:MAG: hypothetical protein MHMPM18_004320, partial [Marteilia pararefringens]